ncbi:hypothetical protein [Caballeronia glathei]|uniref:Uncharacterized protein n=1 Tax=Caballeronia glathei TaxID=60547 RepID=A0A069PGR5_9BURK|nr:hypothetical protein [Caballeronia glathei]KDR39903.1 hypothetical protein BG61_29615 [Caballeronia glathei]
MRQLWLRDHVHLARFLPGHPRRKVRTRTIRLHDDQVRLASIAIHTYDIDALAEARVKRIANDDVVALIMGSMLLVRPGLEKVIWVRPSDTR